MQPVINLKQFLAVLLLLIIPAALLTAYFRNYEPEAGGTGHQHADAAGTHPAGGHGGMAMPSGEGGEQAGHPHGEKEAAAPGAMPEMDHGKMGGATPPPQPGTPMTPEQIEASRLQLEASRAQLEASRKALEATPATPKGQSPPDVQGKPGATPAAKPDAKGGTDKANEKHEHQH